MVTSMLVFHPDLHMWQVLVLVDGAVRFDKWYHTRGIAEIAEMRLVSQAKKSVKESAR